MSEVRDGRMSEALRRRLQVTGPAPAAPELAEQIVSTIVLENDRPEMEYLSGGQLCSGTGLQAAVAAQYPQVQLWNPQGSRVLAVVQELYANTATGFMYLHRYDVALGSVDTSFPYAPMRDTRWDRSIGTFKSSACQIRKVSSGTQFGSHIGYMRFLNRDATGSGFNWFAWDRPIVLEPGSGIHVIHFNVNNFLGVTWHWRERAIGSWEVG